MVKFIAQFSSRVLSLASFLNDRLEVKSQIYHGKKLFYELSKILTVAALSLSPILVATEASAMHGGQPAGDEWGMSVAIQWGDIAVNAPCSATFVTTNLLLTAAHCIYGLSSGAKITIHPREERAGGREFTIARVFTHELFVPDERKQNFHYDIGFVELKEEAATELEISSFPSISREKLAKRETFALVASGPDSETITFNSFSTSTNKKVGYLTLSGRDGDMFVLPSSSGTATCRGDSGGGVFRNTDSGPELVGVIVLGNGSCGLVKGYTAAHDISFSIERIEAVLGYKIGL